MGMKTKVHIFMDDPKDIAYTLRKVADEIERTHPSLLPGIYAGGHANIAGFYSVSIESEAVKAQIAGMDDEHLQTVAAHYRKLETESE
jgi:hypothetical protein